jgi:hypothetical protein
MEGKMQINDETLNRQRQAVLSVNPQSDMVVGIRAANDVLLQSGEVVLEIIRKFRK